MDYKYEPKTKTALISAIRDEIKLQGNRANLNCINTSAITNMRELFNKFKSFEGDISGWDVSNVTDMTDMFLSSQFRGDISSWNVDKVEYFFPMFKWCRIPEEHKPLRFRMNRDANTPLLSGKKKFSDEAEVSFTLTGDGTLTLSGNLKCDLSSDYYYWLNNIPVRKLILSEGITEIGKCMFYGWSNLEEVTFPESLTIIGDSAFERCPKISQLNFPKRGLTKIGSRVFYSLQIRELHLPETLTSIDSYSFSHFEQLEELVLPDSIVFVGYRAFKECTSLKSVKLPAHLKEITEGMFCRCTALEHVEMPAELERIERYAFLDCPNLKYVELPDTVKDISPDAFVGLSFEEGGLDYSITNYITNINTCSVSAKEWEGELDIPSSICHDGRTFIVSEIDFAGCSKLTRVRIPDTVSVIPVNAFGGCTSLRSIDIPSSVTTIGGQAFAGCKSLHSIDLPDTVTVIEDELFDGCCRLRDVRLGANTTSIGDSAFRDCEFLQHIHIPDSMRLIHPHAFENCKNLVEINMPASLECLGTYALEGTAIMKQEGPIYVGNVLCGFGGKMPKHACLEVHEGTTLIAEVALCGRENLENVILPDTLFRIGCGAFNDCEDLKHVKLPKSLIEMGEEAFDWTAISEVEVPWTTPIDAGFRPFPDDTIVFVPVGSRKAYKASECWKDYKIIEKENCGSGPVPFINEDTVIVGRKETYRVILIEKPQRKRPWNLYGVIVSSKTEIDPNRVIKDLLFESFRDTAMFLDWEEDRDAGHCQPLGEVLEYNTHRYAVIDLAEESSPETKIFDGRTYLIDEEFYNSVIKDGKIEWIKLSNN